MTNSREKGKRGEREWAQWLTDHGHPARRGVQYAGGPESPDVVCPSLPIHWEVKRCESLRLWDAIRQAHNEAAPEETPVVAHRRSRSDWICVVSAEYLISLLRRAKAGLL